MKSEENYNLSQKTIKCPNCKKELLDCVSIDCEDTTTKIIVHCPICEDDSFLVKMDGLVQFGSIPPFYLVDVKLTNDIKTFYLGVKNG